MPAPDLTDKFNTKLSAEDEAKFQEWAKANGHAGDTRDYDLRGAWQDNAKKADNGHFPDTYKKPNHPTFSDESKYSTGENKGGSWGGTDDAPTFTPSKANLQNMTPDELQDYFKKVEPNSKLILPQTAQDRRYGTPATDGGN